MADLEDEVASEYNTMLFILFTVAIGVAFLAAGFLLGMIHQRKNQKAKKSITACNIIPAAFHANMRRRSLDVHDVPHDGNCLFAAVTDQLIQSGSVGYTTESLRQRAVNHLRQHPFSPDGTHLGFYVPNESWESYLTRMARPGEWGDSLMLQALAEVLFCRFVIFDSSSFRHTVVESEYGRARNAIRTFYLGHIPELHYVSLRTTADGEGYGVSTDDGDDMEEDSVLQSGLTVATRTNTNIQVGDESSMHVHVKGDSRNNVYRTVKNIQIGSKTNLVIHLNVTFSVPQDVVETIRDILNGRLSDDQSFIIKINRTDLTNENDIQIYKDTVEKKVIQKLNTGAVNVQHIMRKYGAQFVEADEGCIELKVLTKDAKGSGKMLDSFYNGEFAYVLKDVFQQEVEECVLSEDGSTWEMNCMLLMKEMEARLVSQRPSREHGISIKVRSNGEKFATSLTSGQREFLPELMQCVFERSMEERTENAEISVKVLHQTRVSPSDLSLESYRLVNFCRFTAARKKRERRKKTQELQESLQKILGPRSGIQLSEKLRLVCQESQSVGLICKGNKSYGTAFRVGQSYIMTASHVIQALEGLDGNGVGSTADDWSVLFSGLYEVRCAIDTIVFMDKCLDFAILKLHNCPKGTDCSYVNVGHASWNREIHIIGHPKGKLSHKVTERVFPTELPTPLPSIAFCSCCESKVYGHYWIVFKSTFGYGASGSPGIALDGFQRPVVCLMLLGGVYPTWCSLKSHSKEDTRMTYGVKMSAVFDAIKLKSPDLLERVFSHQYGTCY